jgi:hypothetical protein
MTSCEIDYEFTEVLLSVVSRNHVEELLCTNVQRINILLIIKIIFLYLLM